MNNSKIDIPKFITDHPQAYEFSVVDIGGTNATVEFFVDNVNLHLLSID